MRALVAHADRTIPTLKEVESEPLAADELRIQVRGAAVNPADNWVASAAIRSVFDLPESVGLGYDLAGTVVEVGSEVSGFAVGDLVAALHDDLSAPVRAQAELATVPAVAAALVPPGLGPVAAASVPLNALTASQAIDLLGSAEGRSLLITGAAGGVGGYAVALAARAGWQVTGLAREADRDFVRRAGASTHIASLSEAETHDAVLDAAALQETALAAVRDGGAFVGVLPPAPVTPERGIVVSAVAVRADGLRLAELLALSAEGVLEVRVAGEVPLVEAEAAYDKRAEGSQRGRLILVP